MRVLNASAAGAFVCVCQSQVVHVGQQLAVTCSKPEDGGLLPSLKASQAGVFGLDPPLLFPALSETVFDESFRFCVGDWVWELVHPTACL